jgi:hypothetical protein
VTEKRSVWRRVAFAGCGCLVFVAALAGGLVAYNWRAISAGLQRGSAAMTELMGIQRTLMSRYGTADVSVKWMSGTKYSAKEGTTRATGTRLVVTLVNPPFLRDLDLDAAEPKAREIALLAREGLRDPASAPVIEVVLARKVGVGVNFRTNRVFRFAAADLAGAVPSPAP